MSSLFRWFLLILCAFFAACSLQPSSQEVSEIVEVRKRIARLKSQHAENLDEVAAKQNELKALEAEKNALLAECSSLETTLKHAPSEQEADALPDFEKDQITLSNGNTFHADIKELNGNDLRIVIKGREQTGTLSAVESINFH